MAYIERDIFINNELIPLVKTLDLCHPKQKKGVLMAISKLKDTPAADVVEVVWCKDCNNCYFFYPAKEKDKEAIPILYCKLFKGDRKENDFCSYGVKKECIDNKPVTQFDRIKAMNIEELADVLYDTNDKICFENCNASTGNKFSCRFGENVDISECKNCIKRWLESEVTE